MPEHKKLKNAPLQEVIFEARWELQPDVSGKRLIDPGYDFALGKFHGLIKQDFPFTVNKYPEDIPHQALSHKTMYQFWAGHHQWPVIQIGPGIITINDTEKNYIWDKNYYPTVKKALEWLLEAYEDLTFVAASLRYIDVVRVEDYGFSGWESFVREHINFDFANNFNTKGNLRNFQFDQSFEMNDAGMLNINFSNGQNNKKEDIFIWQTAVSQEQRHKKETLMHWLEKAHQCTSDIFKEICKKEFYESFSQ